MRNPTRKQSNLLVIILIIMTIIGIGTVARLAQAATDNPSPGSSGYEQIILHMSGSYTSTVTPVKFKAPWPFRVLSISTRARLVQATSGTAQTYSLDVRQGSTSLLATPIAIATLAADTIIDGAVAATPALVPDEATVSAILTLGGTTPSISDITVIMGIKRQ